MTYTFPVLIVDMTLAQSLADLLLVLLREIIIAFKNTVVLLLGVASHFMPRVRDMLDHRGSSATPEQS